MTDRRRACASLVVATLTSIALAAQTPADRSQTEALAKRAADRLAALRREAESLATQERSLLAELRKLEIDRAIKVEQLQQIHRDAAAIQQKLAAAAMRNDALKNEAERQRPDIEARLVQVYKMGRAGYWRLLVDVNNLPQIRRPYRPPTPPRPHHPHPL